ETATFNETTCVWDVTGTKPAAPTVACYETATFNDVTCVWDVTGTKPVEPTVACYETATFNDVTCVWDVTGAKPAAPTVSEITQPTCSVATGSFTITNFDSALTYFVTPNTGVTINGSVVTAPEGSYTIVSSLNNCESEVSAPIIINAQPINPEIQGTPGYAKCNDDVDAKVNLTVLLPQGTTIGGTWINVNNVGSIVSEDGIDYFKPFEVAVGNYLFKYDVMIDGCQQIININMEVDDDCAVLPCGDQNVAGYAKCNDDIDAKINLTALLPQGTPVGGTWTNVDNVGNLVNIDGIEYFEPYGVSVGTYLIKYEVLNVDCLQVVNVNMEVDDDCKPLPECNILVHNAFSPNGDGINDTLVIENIENRFCFPSVKVEIYNRWGVLVYEVNNYDNSTNSFTGYSNGRTTISQSEGLPTGTYFYIIQLTNSEGKVINKDGYLYLTR
ncbi:MAG TPA: gliding motility-associated C-terminal domain-containing protein, partial [Flavobacterium sp.]|nr:gliding motility-associated C-terminal domain-containing protein [Flavobacterium sp.]